MPYWLTTKDSNKFVPVSPERTYYMLRGLEDDMKDSDTAGYRILQGQCIYVFMRWICSVAAGIK